MKGWPASSHSFPGQGLPLEFWKTYVWAAERIRWEAGWVYSGAHSERGANAEAESAGKIKVRFATVGRPDLSQGILCGDKTD